MMKDMSCLLAVNGTLMRGLALERNLLDVGAVFCREAQTAACYRLWSVRDEYPAMLRVAPGDPAGASIAVEIWSVPAGGLAAILAGEPAGLSVGKVRLLDGQEVFGVIAEPIAVDQMREITCYGGWRAYLAATKN